MRLTSEEIAEITAHLTSVLKRKRFSVKTNRYGNILYAEKFGIRCCPAILNSLEDGRHGYAYIQLVTNPYSEKDLGSYYKPRTNKDSHKFLDKNDAVDKYAGKDNHIDMHNYKAVIEKFANDLNKDYRRITMQREELELDYDDSGTCKWNSLHQYWEVTSTKVKSNICHILRNNLDTTEYFSEGNLEVMENPQWFNGTWAIKYYSKDKYISIDNLDLVRDSRFYIPGPVCSEILNYIEHWVRDNQERIWSESLVESVVKIKDTGTVFDGMTGTVEKDDGNKLTVMVDFNDEHKVRNIFNKEQLEILED